MQVHNFVFPAARAFLLGIESRKDGVDLNLCSSGTGSSCRSVISSCESVLFCVDPGIVGSIGWIEVHSLLDWSLTTNFVKKFERPFVRILFVLDDVHLLT